MDKLQLRKDDVVSEQALKPHASDRKYKIIYPNAIFLAYVHVAAICGLYFSFNSARWETIYFNFLLYIIAGLGITAGAHRLWSHRSYKAKLPLQVILMLFNCVSSQRSILKWARDHRLHHKHSDTDADPHNASRGLFYSHIGWLMVKKHPEAIEKGKLIDASDLMNNPVLMFQDKYSLYLFGSLSFLIPTLVPIIFWEESIINFWHIAFFRYCFSINAAFVVNSVAHRWGYRPYDSRIMPAQNVLMSVITLGEAFHNYHHVFPWDYRTAEVGNDKINFTTKFIDFFAWIGWAYDLKSASNNMIKTRIQRTGDGTNLWGLHDSTLD